MIGGEAETRFSGALSPFDFSLRLFLWGLLYIRNGFLWMVIGLGP